MDYNPRIGPEPGVYPETDPESEYLGSGYHGEKKLADGGFGFDDIDRELSRDTA